MSHGHGPGYRHRSVHVAGMGTGLMAAIMPIALKQQVDQRYCSSDGCTDAQCDLMV